MRHSLIFVAVLMSFGVLIPQAYSKSLCYFAYTAKSCNSHEKIRNALRHCQYDHIKNCIGKNKAIATDVCYRDYYFHSPDVPKHEYKREMENCKKAGISPRTLPAPDLTSPEANDPSLE